MACFLISYLQRRPHSFERGPLAHSTRMSTTVLISWRRRGGIFLYFFYIFQRLTGSAFMHMRTDPRTSAPFRLFPYYPLTLYLFPLTGAGHVAGDPTERERSSHPPKRCGALPPSLLPSLMSSSPFHCFQSRHVMPHRAKPTNCPNARIVIFKLRDPVCS